MPVWFAQFIGSEGVAVEAPNSIGSNGDVLVSKGDGTSAWDPAGAGGGIAAGTPFDVGEILVVSNAAAGNEEAVTDGLTTATITGHINSTSNPHSVNPGQIGAEPDLGDPASDGYVLSSTAAGVRSWIAQGGSSPWEPGIPTDSIYYSTGNVGIGTDNPGYPLEVAGQAQIGGTSQWVGIGGAPTAGAQLSVRGNGKLFCYGTAAQLVFGEDVGSNWAGFEYATGFLRFGHTPHRDQIDLASNGRVSFNGAASSVGIPQGRLDIKDGEFAGSKTSATATPTTTDLPTDTQFSIVKGSTGDVFLAYNDGGVIKTVQLT